MSETNEQDHHLQHDQQPQDVEQQKNARSEEDSATEKNTPAEPVKVDEELAPRPSAKAVSQTGLHEVANSSKENTGKPPQEDVAPDNGSDSQAAREQRIEASNAEVLAVSRRHTRRSFLGAAAAVAAGVGFYEYLNLAPGEDMQPVPLADAFKFNAAFSRSVLPQQALSPTYPLSRAETLRVNGVYGLKKDIVPESWRLQLVGMKDASQHPRFVADVTAWEYHYKEPPANEDKGHDTKVDPSKQAGAPPAPAPGKGGPPPASGQAPPGAPPDNQKNGGQGAQRGTAPRMVPAPDPLTKTDDADGEDENHTGRKKRGMEEAGESDSTLPPHTPGLLLQLPDITCLPRVELVTQFKCIEGWSQIVHWGGVRMADFLELYPPALIDGKEPKYVYMETPDGDYYTGYDMQIMRHPQTLLVTEMMGAPITQKHGAPLRLHMPTKYGYKQIKRIGLIAYTNDKPDDYWTKLGYDWYAGL